MTGMHSVKTDLLAKNSLPGRLADTIISPSDHWHPNGIFD